MPKPSHVIRVDQEVYDRIAEIAGLYDVSTTYALAILLKIQEPPPMVRKERTA